KSRIAALMGIRGRELSRTESKYLESWIEMGFDDEAIAAAFDRTLTNTGALKWPYLNGILKNWHAKGLHDAAAIEASEGKRQTSAGRTDPKKEDEDEDIGTKIEQYWGDKA
ncbi:MAG: DnaD domain protein, partial [Oscillospiraceae bacterium]|nr:DnaD domain protein [Oscillospiraceae bacterium]